MKTEYVNHKNENRIRLIFAYDKVVIKKIKTIPGALWSKTMGAWHVPDKENVRATLEQLFPEIQFTKNKNIDNTYLPSACTLEKNGTTKLAQIRENSPDTNLKEPQVAEGVNNPVGISNSYEFIFLKLKKDETDIAFLRTLHYNKWDKTLFLWIITNTKLNRELINNYFNKRLVKMPVPQLATKTVDEKVVHKKANTLYIVEYTEGRVRLLFDFNEKFVRFIKTIAFNKWDPFNKWWSIPYSPSIHKNIEILCGELGWKMEVVNQKETEIKKLKAGKDKILNYRSCPPEMIDKLTMLRYSPKTAKSYIAALEEFINFHNTKDIKSLGPAEIKEFIMYLINERKISVSYQNVTINAIKFYMEHVNGCMRQYITIERPKEERKLPKVISRKEIKMIIENVDNLKHRCIIMLLYSAGLRRSELLNLIPTDIDSENMRILIREGKGGKDRYTILSKTTLETLKMYYKMYRPLKYLFEGREKEKYSAESVAKIVKEASAKAGIKRIVSPHILRHSFATHLLEDGVDMRYIQNLLGHYSTKTTEIYTHITQKGIERIKSPLDD
jgi:site-specific recombinase XerD